jgi:phosphoglycolate phosphatase
VEMALQPSGIAPGADVWFVGDTAIDMECALAAGCVPVLLGAAEPADEFSTFPPALTVADDAALFRALRGL